MFSNPSFEFAEDIVFSGSYSWRLKDGELRYRGTDQFRDPSIIRLPVRDEQIERFVAALDFLDVWHWKEHYDPEDAGYCADDGGSWSFRALIRGRSCNTSGTNAFPSFDNVTQTTVRPERFAMLAAAVSSVFGAKISSWR